MRTIATAGQFNLNHRRRRFDKFRLPGGCASDRTADKLATNVLLLIGFGSLRRPLDLKRRDLSIAPDDMELGDGSVGVVEPP